MHVELSIPNERRFFHIARLLFGGAASRLDMGYEAVDDVQLAIESLLAAGLCDGPEITLEIAVEQQNLSLWIGPFDADALAARLRDDGNALSFDRLLGQLVDSAEPTTRENRTGLLLLKRLPQR